MKRGSEEARGKDDDEDKRDFPGWRKAALEIIEKHGKSKKKYENGKNYMKQKAMLKKIWKMYTKSKVF